ncbi:MAG: hypothetical protein QOE86_1961 [Solirubrobacteraceae bacterium]|nr:hypothetical protein [Solirubrobacteraceae bacterium]
MVRAGSSIGRGFSGSALLGAETLGGEARGSNPATARLIDDVCAAAARPVGFDAPLPYENEHPLNRGAGAAAGL